jgi:hypothetical protein
LAQGSSLPKHAEFVAAIVLVGGQIVFAPCSPRRLRLGLHEREKSQRGRRDVDAAFDDQRVESGLAERFVSTVIPIELRIGPPVPDRTRT